jgi:glycerol-3-phosphate dehydrogenase (NAD(P)+)
MIAATRHNPRLPGFRLPDGIRVTHRMPAADLTMLAVPVPHLRGVAAQLDGAEVLVVCAKGLEAAGGALPLEILAMLRPGRPALVLTGPNFAHEVAAGLPSASVVSGPDPAWRARVIEAFSTSTFRLYENDDTIGTQIGGAAKNVIAIAAGCVIGAGLGENARAALVTRGLAEIARLAEALGGRAATVFGLSGLGDLLLTCTGTASRNMSVGLALGRGEGLAAARGGASGVAEGVLTASALVARAAQCGVEMPICATVAALLEGRIDVAGAIGSLLSRPIGPE